MFFVPKFNQTSLLLQPTDIVHQDMICRAQAIVYQPETLKGRLGVPAGDAKSYLVLLNKMRRLHAETFVCDKLE